MAEGNHEGLLRIALVIVAAGILLAGCSGPGSGHAERVNVALRVLLSPIPPPAPAKRLRPVLAAVVITNLGHQTVWVLDYGLLRSSRSVRPHRLGRLDQRNDGVLLVRRPGWNHIFLPIARDMGLMYRLERQIGPTVLPGRGPLAAVFRADSADHGLNGSTQ